MPHTPHAGALPEQLTTTRPIGVIADTHGLLREEAIVLLKGCDPILHLGDVGDFSLLERLAAMARLYTVRGNIDTQSWCEQLPWRQDLIVNGWHLHLVHDKADFDPAAPCDAMLHGHSHKALNEWRDTPDGRPRLWFNPGGAGKRRFRLPITLGRLWAEETQLRRAILHLPLID
ncbi:metallophosphoesterase family protein [Kushneria phosphatilytica]|uniref:Metallophosphoesterase family protein n=1 Tax=Kushneria phosphatilytica TaxID=657387 RepID=A0A1S1NTB4_9GAMM|nr:metallophosphoesterase family protein [Kushneria phosphatilytica]OHV07585.1 YfcE family phosphodiesterase [Kushneria phosphatilytica]QEL10068.1 metallophosphoesterase family protein [Kushneria phosphatilytica]